MKQIKLFLTFILITLSYFLVSLGISALSLTQMDWNGGTVIHIRYENPISIQKVKKILNKTEFYRDSTVEFFGSEKEISISTTNVDLNIDMSDKIFNILKASGKFEVRGIDMFGPAVGEELRNKFILLIIVIIVLIIMMVILVIYLNRYTNKIVTKLTKEPKALLTLSQSQLKEAKQKLETIDQLESTLKEEEVTKEQFEKTLEFYESQAEQKAQLFAQQIEAKECKKEGDFYRIKMSEDFRLDALKSFLLYISDESSSKIEKEVTALNDKVFVLANEEQQNAVAKLAHDKTNRVIAPRVEELTELMLSSEPQEKFVTILSNCLLAKDVSPYQLNGDVKSESNFFGRVEILREIISNDEVNYLIVGARQLGKSSILKALERRYAKSTKVVCYSFTLDESGELLPVMAEALGLESGATLDEIVESIKAHKKKPIFLIDEADKFVKHEKERGYLITSVLRKLSQEGEATFVMVGFWTLYEYANTDYQSPLKNFGKFITLGGLEEEACQQLMIEPMKHIGISYESKELVEETVKRCGYRANYIATVCDVVLKKLEGSVIDKEAVEEALESETIDKMLRGWGSLSANKEANRLDRLIVYLTINKESFRLGDVVKGLEQQGLNIDIERVNDSLDRLVLGYVVGKHKGNYSYQIPLLKERILEDDLEFLVNGEVKGLIKN